MPRFYLSMGMMFFVLAWVGVFIPVLPTTPLLLIASFFFAKGSPKFYQWFCATPIYKKHLESFVKHRSATLKAKVSILLSVSLILLAIAFLTSSLILIVLLIILLIIKYYYFIFKIKTVKPTSKEQSAKCLEIT